MHGEAPTKTTKNGEKIRLKRVNECLKAIKYPRRAEYLFDEFWRDGELTLLFGAAGTGKSILATQIAEAVARGRALDGFLMTATRRKVLYVDLKLTVPQLNERYMKYERGAKPVLYKFSDNLYRERPPSAEDLAEWLRKMVTAGSIRVVVIDDISAVRTNADGVRESLKLMRDLKDLTRELGISILVLAGSREPRRGRNISDADLQRSCVLCDEADSVFAIGMHPTAAANRYLVQVRSHREQVWNAANAPHCVIDRADDGFLGFTFDKRFVPQMDEATRRMICDIKRRRDRKVSFSQIAEALGISQTKVSRLLKKWRPEFDCPGEFDDEPEISAGPNTDPVDVDPSGDAPNPDDVEEWEECDFEKPVWLDESTHEDNECGVLADEPPNEIPAEPVPLWEGTRSIFLALGYEVRVDDLGKELFVESVDGTGRPVIAYRFHTANGKVHPRGTLSRLQYDAFGMSGETVNGPVCSWHDSKPARRGIIHKARVYLKSDAEA
jgi:KaiC/GvpD/RAD55 family RecA-like ATPase